MTAHVFQAGDWVRVRKPADPIRDAWPAEMDRHDGGVFAVLGCVGSGASVRGYRLHGGGGFVFWQEWLEPAPEPSVYVVEPLGPATLTGSGTVFQSERRAGDLIPADLRDLRARPTRLPRQHLCRGCDELGETVGDEALPAGWVSDHDGRRSWCSETCWARWASNLLDRRPVQLHDPAWMPAASPSLARRAVAWAPWFLVWASLGAAATSAALSIAGRLPW